MSASKWFMEAAGQVLQGLHTPMAESFNAVLEAAEGIEDFDTGAIQIAYAVRPKSLSPKDFIVRAPYAKPEHFATLLAGSAERGWLEAVGEGQYTVSDKGAKVVDRLLETMNEALTGLEALPDADLKRIHELMKKVVKKAYELPEPAEKWHLDRGKDFQKTLVVEGAPKLVWVRRRIIDMFGYRDDVHVAAWKAYEENGQIWETFTVIWNGELGTAAEIAERYHQYRNYDEAAYAAALSELAERGWITEEDGKYTATEKGKELRQKAEDDTNRLYDAPWAALDEAETEELKGLLGKLAAAVKPPEPEGETE